MNNKTVYVVRIYDKNNKNYEINHWTFNNENQAELCKAEKRAQGFFVKIDSMRV